jgi:hypothetical protein
MKAIGNEAVLAFVAALILVAGCSSSPSAIPPQSVATTAAAASTPPPVIPASTPPAIAPPTPVSTSQGISPCPVSPTQFAAAAGKGWKLSTHLGYCNYNRGPLEISIGYASITAQATPGVLARTLSLLESGGQSIIEQSDRSVVAANNRGVSGVAVRGDVELSIVGGYSGNRVLAAADASTLRSIVKSLATSDAS